MIKIHLTTDNCFPNLHAYTPWGGQRYHSLRFSRDLSDIWQGWLNGTFTILAPLLKIITELTSHKNPF